ncbi:hypothetical protein BZA05DRAFT_453983, partial [Tricharina praecox]|uniref:uncharacterized protein n=1 Tax=Tricharina praecox TaxID=43433 RepID=UPI002220B086
FFCCGLLRASLRAIPRPTSSPFSWVDSRGHPPPLSRPPIFFVFVAILLLRGYPSPSWTVLYTNPPVFPPASWSSKFQPASASISPYTSLFHRDRLSYSYPPCSTSNTCSSTITSTAMSPPPPHSTNHASVPKPNPKPKPNRDSGISIPASPTSLCPASPAPTTSDIHNSNQHQQLPDTSPSPPPSRSERLSRSPVMTRFMTIDPNDSPLRFEEMVAIREGRVRLGEDMLEKRRREMDAEDMDEGVGGDGARGREGDGSRVGRE